jgi:hypothetical protein
MVVLAALRSALAGLARNPVLFVATGVLALFQLPQFAAQALGPLAASAVSALFSLVSVVVVPFFQAGLLGMADEAIDGRTRLRTFVDAGRDHYVSMLVAYLLMVAVHFVYWLVVVVVGVLFLAFAFGAGGNPLADPATLAIAVALAAVVLLLSLGFVFFVQFYGQAIVVDDLGAIDGYRRSVRLVRRNLVSTLAYFLLAGFLGLLFGGVVGGASILASPRTAELLPVPPVSPGVTVAVVVLALVLAVLASAFFATFSVAFYREIASAEAALGAAQSGD